ncbi:MAG: hypothetical protein OIF50_08955, partial [Flavobacteriaceae bacterium]|nr:hypothetical protein [Flavobacteriaceae bacterium]
MIRRIIVGIAFLASWNTYSQEGSISPYSFFGLGDVDFAGTVENQSMGGLITFRDSIHVNLKNPASYANLRITNFSVGGTFNSTNYETSSNKQNAQQVTFNYISLAMQTSKKSSFGFGLVPYSSVGYKLRSTNDEVTVRNDFEGSGGVNKVFLTYARNLFKGFSIGATINYNFGTLENMVTKSQNT